jgi:ABC-2 type transport system permease protein
VEVTVGSVSAIANKGELLRKISFPRYVIVLAGSFSAVINLMLNLIVVAVFMHFGHLAFSWHDLYILPLLAELFIFSLAVAFFLSATYIRFRDVSYIWDVIIQAGFYATPILYPLTRIPHKYAKLLILNPMAQMVQDIRYIVVTHKTINIATLYGDDKYIWLIPFSIVIIVAVVGSLYFRSRSRFFAEEV